MQELPYKIKRLRELRNFTQAYMATCLGISLRGYSKIENGRSALTVQRLQQIADALECSAGELIDKPLGDLMAYHFGK